MVVGKNHKLSQGNEMFLSLVSIWGFEFWNIFEPRWRCSKEKNIFFGFRSFLFGLKMTSFLFDFYFWLCSIWYFFLFIEKVNVSDLCKSWLKRRLWKVFIFNEDNLLCCWLNFKISKESSESKGLQNTFRAFSLKELHFFRDKNA